MDMEDRLAGVAIAIEHGAIAAIVESSLACHASRLSNHAAHKPIVCRGQVVDGCDVPAWNHERVKWGLRVDVLDDNQRFVLVEDLRRYLVRDDLAEKTIGHGDVSEEVAGSSKNHRAGDVLKIASDAEDSERGPVGDQGP
jgi:hypothetical protein